MVLLCEFRGRLDEDSTFASYCTMFMLSRRWDVLSRVRDPDGPHNSDPNVPPRPSGRPDNDKWPHMSRSDIAQLTTNNRH